MFRQLFSFRKKEIQKVFKFAKLRARDRGLRLLRAGLDSVYPEGIDHGKLLIVTMKKSGKAVTRNKFKRQAKAIFYDEKLYEKPYVYVLIAYKIDPELTFSELKDFLTSNT